MSCTVSGFVVLAQAAGTVRGLGTKKVYLRPSRTDLQFSFDSGTTWQSWQGDPDLASSYPGAISATTDQNGAWAFKIPWTDDTSETRLPGGASAPALLWNIIDPNPATGTVVYVGATPMAIVSTAKTIKELITLASPDTWRVGDVTYSAVPVGPRRFVTVPFTSASDAAAIVFPDIGSTSWGFNVGIETDDADPTGFYSIKVQTASKSSTGASIKISDLPPAGSTTLAKIEVYL